MFALYESLRRLQQMWRGDICDPAFQRTVERIPSLALTFSMLSELGPDRVEEAKQHGWPLASRNAYPMVMATGSEEETRVLIAATRVLGPFAKGLTRGRWMPEDVKCIQEIHRPEVVGDKVEVHAFFPGPASPNKV